MKTALEYPAALEAWWVREAERATNLKAEKALAALVETVEKLSVNFTRERPEIFHDYTSSAMGCAAYGAYFFPQTFTRVSHVMNNLGIWGFGDLEILDVGSGTGAAGMAVARWAACHGIKAKITAMDKSQKALETGRRAFEGCKKLWPSAEWESVCEDIQNNPVEKKHDLILCSFVFNELGGATARLQAARQMLGQLNESGALIILEPAGEESSRALMEMRDTLAKEGVQIVAPCPHQEPCPMRVAGVGFCHDVRKWRVPNSLEFVNRKLQRTVWDVKVSYLVVGRDLRVRHTNTEQGATKDENLAFRVVAPVTRTKARVITRGCCADGTLRDFELQCRDASKPELRAFDEWERGDLAAAEVERLLGDGKTWRVKKMNE